MSAMRTNQFRESTGYSKAFIRAVADFKNVCDNADS